MAEPESRELREWRYTVIYRGSVTAADAEEAEARAVDQVVLGDCSDEHVEVEPDDG